MLSLFSGIVPFFIKYFKPKVFFGVAMFVTTLSMVLIGTFAYVRNFHPNMPYLDHFSWIPLVMMTLLIIMRAVYLPILLTLIGEIFPTEIRSESNGFVFSACLLIAALSVKLYPQIKYSIGLYGLFYYYGAFSFACCLWGLKTIPDNRGKSLVKIEEMNGKKQEMESSSEEVGSKETIA